MRTNDFDYDLPQELIAQTPVEPRDSSRMLVLDRRTGEVQHSRFANLTDHLLPGDLMVFNRSRVIPARLRGRRSVTGGKVEFLLLSREEPGLWRALARPGRRLQPGARVLLDTPTGSAVEAGREYDVEVQASGEDGLKLIAFVDESIIEKSGLAPLPPYIHSRLEDPERYQTIYARDPGSAAAPTAGLHFTEESLAALTWLGIELAFVTLHVGLDTFRPVQEEDPADHKIHTEYFEIDAGTSAALNQAREQGRRIIAVGTTSVRVLEQIGQELEGDGIITPIQGQAGLFILPGHEFRLVDGMITNFHLPRSTLLMLVSAFAGRDHILNAYREAVQDQYRFYSFGDAMLIA